MKKNPLKEEIKTFDSMKDKLLADYYGKYVIIHDSKFVDSFDTFDTAAREAIKQFGNGPYLIRQVTERPPMSMPTSVAFPCL